MVCTLRFSWHCWSERRLSPPGLHPTSYFKCAIPVCTILLCTEHFYIERLARSSSKNWQSRKATSLEGTSESSTISASALATVDSGKSRCTYGRLGSLRCRLSTSQDRKRELTYIFSFLIVSINWLYSMNTYRLVLLLQSNWLVITTSWTTWKRCTLVLYWSSMFIVIPTNICKTTIKERAYVIWVVILDHMNHLPICHIEISWDCGSPRMNTKLSMIGAMILPIEYCILMPTASVIRTFLFEFLHYMCF